MKRAQRPAPMRSLASCLALVAACGEVVHGGANLAPTDIELSATSVEEQALSGTRVGLLSAVDPDPGDRHTFALVDDAGGRFRVDGADLLVAPGAVLDHESEAAVTVTVAATDEAGATLEKELAIDILDLREVVNTEDSGAGSLRQAIADAEPGETILFENGVDGAIGLASVLLLTKNVTIRGPQPPAAIALDGLAASRVFDVSPAATVTLQQLTIRGGASSGAGGIFNEGVLTVERCRFEDNLADGTGRGGAIGNRGTLTARDSLFLRNRGFNGGAVAADGEGGTVIERCTFQENATTGNTGGAVLGGQVQILNSTFVGNSASDETQDRVGGAVAVFSGDNLVAFSTFTGNFADGDGGAIYCELIEAAALTLTVRGAIVSDNDAGLSGPDLEIAAGCTAAVDHSVVSVAGGTGLTDGVDGNVVGTSVSLAPLADNGGFTPTALPAAGAASIDLVPAASCTDLADQPLAEDQRGTARPAGDGCDAGAVER